MGIVKVNSKEVRVNFFIVQPKGIVLKNVSSFIVAFNRTKSTIKITIGRD